MKGGKPLLHGKVRAVHNRADGDAELLSAIAAFPKSIAGSFTVQFKSSARTTTMRTNCAFRPADAFNFLARLFFSELSNLKQVHGKALSFFIALIYEKFLGLSSAYFRIVLRW